MASGGTMKPRPELLAALIQQESKGNNSAVSPKGARGLAQVMPKTGVKPGYGVKPLADSSPQEQHRFANDYLGAMLKKYKGNEKLALAAYNAGPGNVDKYKGIPPFKETRKYVDNILHAINPISSANASVNEANDMPQQKLTEVTDPELLRQLEGDNSPQQLAQPKLTEVTDPEILRQLEGGNEPAQPESTFLKDVQGGIASAPINLYLGAKQLLGGLDSEEQNILAQNREAASKAPVSAFLGNVATAVPTAFIPGANTVAGAGLIGATQGLLQPSDSTKERLLNTGIGGLAGASGQKAMGVIGKKLSNTAATQAATAATKNALNAPKQALLDEFQQAGYVVPGSAVNPSFLNKRLESIAGKAAVGQEAAVKNQQITNDLARKSIGLADDTPLSNEALTSVKKEAGKVYEEVGNLSPIAKQDNEALKQARFDAKTYYKHYNVSFDPSSLAKAKQADDLVKGLETSIEAEANASGRPDLVQALKDARVLYAKTGTVDRALNDSTGEVSAVTLGKLLAKNQPLTAEQKTIGQFNQTFSPYSREGAKVPTPGVSKSEALASIMLGAGGFAGGGPAGALLGAAPLLAGPVRSLILSKPYQQIMARYPVAKPSATISALADLLSNSKIQGMTPALSSQLATELYKQGQQQ